MQAFTAWVNTQLTAVGQRPLEAHLSDRFTTGTNLAALLCAVSGVRVRVRGSSHAAVCRGNLDQVLTGFTEVAVGRGNGSSTASRLRRTNANDFYTGHTQNICAFLWAIVATFDRTARNVSQQDWIAQAITGGTEVVTNQQDEAAPREEEEPEEVLRWLPVDSMLLHLNVSNCGRCLYLLLLQEDNGEDSAEEEDADEVNTM